METPSQLTGRIHSFESAGAVDGPGIRFVVFMQGCPLRCLFCHNPDTWNVRGGRVVTGSDIVNEALKYQDFMRFSNGGVTFSGGEPLLQRRFLIPVFDALKQHQIHIALDTSGAVDLDTDTQTLLSKTDLVLLDVKHLVPEKHIEITGLSNDKTLAVLDYLCACNKPTWIRWVVLPGYNDTPEYAEKYATFIQKYPNVELVELLPYHKNGIYKWQELGLKYKLENTPEPMPATIKELADILEKHGLKTLY